MKKIYSLMMICLLCMQLVLPVYAAQPETDSLDTMTQIAQEQKDTTTGSNGTETTKDADTKKNTENTDTADTIKPQTKEDTSSGGKILLCLTSRARQTIRSRQSRQPKRHFTSITRMYTRA